MARRIQGLILAGGESRRYGEDKAFAMWEGKTFLRRVADALEGSCDELWILGRQEVGAPKYHEIVPEARILMDVQAQAGPVAALRQALKHGRADFMIVAPCDAPALTQEHIALLLTTARQSKGPAVAVTDGSVLYDLFCAPRNLIEERVKTAKRLEDLCEDAKQVPLPGAGGLNVNRPV